MILVALVTRRALGIINLCGLELIVIQNSNLMTTFFNLYFDTPKAAGKNGFLIIFIKACKRVSLLVHGRWLLYVQQKSNLYFFNALFSCRGSGCPNRVRAKILIQALKDKF